MVSAGHDGYDGMTREAESSLYARAYRKSFCVARHRVIRVMTQSPKEFPLFFEELDVARPMHLRRLVGPPSLASGVRRQLTSAALVLAVSVRGGLVDRLMTTHQMCAESAPSRA
jgi:hypothetical protein